MIEVRDLHFRYPGAHGETLHGIDFAIEKGEVFGFLGPSGAGKTTTQKIIIGILKDYAGQVRVLGKELKDLDSAYYEKIGVAFEFPNLYTKFTALENLDFFRSLYAGPTEDPMTLLSLVGLEQDANRRVSGFSKGMKMRLNFCRAFLNRPELLFLDEPTSGLDPVNARKVKDIILEKKARGKTVFLTTHNMNVAEEICDRVAFIVDGQLSLIDSPRELKISRGTHTVQVEYRNNGALSSKEFQLAGLGNNEHFMRLLQEQEIETIHSQEATLEKIFIEVTGRSLV